MFKIVREITLGNNDDARDRILKATAEILSEASDIDKITVRQIAARADVGVGLINYHFQSKENLLSIAVGNVLVHMAGEFIAPSSNLNLEPVNLLRAMLKALFSYAKDYEKLLRFSVSQSIQNGDMQAQLFLIPVLREIFGERKDEMQLRILALQILLPLQVPSMCPSAFCLYSGIDLYDDTQRDNYINILIDNIIK